MVRFIGLALLVYFIIRYAGFLGSLFQSKRSKNAMEKPGSKSGRKGEYIDFEEIKKK